MKLITNDRGFEEIEIANNTGFENFYLFAGQLMEITGIRYESKLDDFDSLYWDFSYRGIGMTLHYNVFLGTCIFLRKTVDASPEEKAALRKLSELLLNHY